ncbi:TonB-dependent receptor plug domain-containing protein [Adhaeribacter pallidiroseus]|nr:TonB-dependent receptor plug domain-containing protein [Adhaeribacter pallidiroseus]
MKVRPPVASSVLGLVKATVEQTVKGKVTATTGEPLPFVNVLLKGTSSGATTDAAGNYTITVPDNNAVLVFSYIGYINQEITVGNRTTIDVQLVSDTKALEEVVVVGYGTQNKATLTGSVSQVAGAEIAKSPSANVTASLQGRTPGLTANQRSGQPGRDDPSILIRGTGTLNDNGPLIIVDGVPRSQLSRLNPEDIESISVLKDASAAIYGARGPMG